MAAAAFTPRWRSIWLVSVMVAVGALAACGSEPDEPPQGVAGSAGEGGGVGGAGGAGGEPTSRPFSIRFDYRFDSKGMFDPPERRAALAAAAAIWAELIDEDFEDVPAGTEVLTRDPEAPEEPGQVFPIEEAIDDLVVFVGFATMDGPGGALASSYPSAAIGSVSDPVVRASLEERNSGPDFEPWTGWLSFDESESWFFDLTPETDGDIPAADNDFISVALHELGHILGFGTADAHFALVDGQSQFIGPAAVAYWGGPVPLSSSGVHIAAGVLDQGQRPLMDPSDARGERSVVTALDRAMFTDLGHVLVP